MMFLTEVHSHICTAFTNFLKVGIALLNFMCGYWICQFYCIEYSW